MPTTIAGLVANTCTHLASIPPLPFSGTAEDSFRVTVIKGIHRLKWGDKFPVRIEWDSTASATLTAKFREFNELIDATDPLFQILTNTMNCTVSFHEEFGTFTTIHCGQIALFWSPTHFVFVDKVHIQYHNTNTGSMAFYT